MLKMYAPYATMLALVSAPSAQAANIAIIQQVGPGSVEVEQSGSNNSVEIKQKIETKKSVEIKGSADKPEKNVKPKTDYQKSVIENPQSSQRARATTIIRQQGPHNEATTSQDADETEVYLKQEGKENHYRPLKTGKSHKSTVIQNDILVEEPGN